MEYDDLLERLARANASVAERYPGEADRRQPVHTVYGGAQIFKRGTAARLGQLARSALDRHAGSAEELAAAVEWDGAPEVFETVFARILDKLEREPVEDFRIDFEDGYGNRPDDEEDADAERTAAEAAAGSREGTAPPFLGIRLKPLTEDLKRRSLKTLELFVRAAVEAGNGALPENFVVTLPKVTHPAQVEVLVEALARLEQETGLAEGSLVLELMVETPQSIFAADGRVAISTLVEAAAGRCVAAHFGTYDYTASVQITAAYQHMTHPACDFARHVQQVALAGTGIWISDGATNVLPVEPHRAREGGILTAGKEAENRDAVRSAWRLHYQHVRHSLEHGYYQGWDLHPAQLVTRYAAVYAFFLEGLEAAGTRLRNFVDQAAQATLVGDVFDDAATGQGLLNYFLRALNCGAVSPETAAESSGLSIQELKSRSFLKILEARRD